MSSYPIHFAQNKHTCYCYNVVAFQCKLNGKKATQQLTIPCCERAVASAPIVHWYSRELKVLAAYYDIIRYTY